LAIGRKRGGEPGGLTTSPSGVGEWAAGEGKKNRFPRKGGKRGSKRSHATEAREKGKGEGRKRFSQRGRRIRQPFHYRPKRRRKYGGTCPWKKEKRQHSYEDGRQGWRTLSKKRKERTARPHMLTSERGKGRADHVRGKKGERGISCLVGGGTGTRFIPGEGCPRPSVPTKRSPLRPCGAGRKKGKGSPNLPVGGGGERGGGSNPNHRLQRWLNVRGREGRDLSHQGEEGEKDCSALLSPPTSLKGVVGGAQKEQG